MAGRRAVGHSGRVSQREYYWCSRHQRVESDDDLCPARFRLGPYPTVAEAKRALEKVEQRNEAWEAEDARWDGEDDDW